jgi:Ni/Co efflux regulator RcnB
MHRHPKEKEKVMKRLISSVLALSLLGATVATAANAAPVNRPIPVRDYRHGNDNGAAVAAGIGFIALAAILASQNNRDRDDWQYRDRNWDHRDYRYDNGRYDNGRYGYGRYNNRYDAYSHGTRGW